VLLKLVMPTGDVFVGKVHQDDGEIRDALLTDPLG
jgi:hypothetical protein